MKASIAVAELAPYYAARTVKLSDTNVKSPSIIDPKGPDSALIGLFGSSAILIYLAERTGKLPGQFGDTKTSYPATADVPDGRA